MRRRPLLLMVVVTTAVLFGLSGCDVINEILGLNEAPIADAGPDQTKLPGETVILNGSNSSDPDGDALTYTWSLLAVPPGYTGGIANSTQSIAQFDADLPGLYQAQLTVSDGEANNTDTVLIDATNQAISVPTGLTVTGTTSSTASLSWNAVTGATSYLVYRDNAQSGAFSQVVGTPSTNSFTDTNGLAPLTSYWYKVKATNGSTYSSYSSAVQATTQAGASTVPVQPIPPTFGTVTQTSVVVNWASQADADSYILQRANDAGFTTGLVQVTPNNYTMLSFTNFGLTANTIYHYRVIAKNTVGQSTPSNGASVTTLTASTNQAPTAATILNPIDGATNIDPTIPMILSWNASTDPDADPVTYDVWGGENTAPNVLLASSTPNTSVNVGYLNYGSTYQWQVVAKDNQGHVTVGPIWTFSTEPPTGDLAPVIQYAYPSQWQVSTGTSVFLYGYATDPEAQAVTYNWVLYSQPGAAVVMNPDLPTASFTPDVAGTYYFYLEVHDPTFNYAYYYFSVTAVAGGGGYGYGIQ